MQTLDSAKQTTQKSNRPPSKKANKSVIELKGSNFEKIKVKGSNSSTGLKELQHKSAG